MSIQQLKSEKLIVFGYVREHCVVNIPIVLIFLILKYFETVILTENIDNDVFKALKRLENDEQLQWKNPLKINGLSFHLVMQKSSISKAEYFVIIKPPKDVLAVTLTYSILCVETDSFFTNTMSKTRNDNEEIPLLCAKISAYIKINKNKKFTIKFIVSEILKIEYRDYAKKKTYMSPNIIMVTPSYVKWTINKCFHEMKSEEKYKFFDRNNWALKLQTAVHNSDWPDGFIDLKLILLKFPPKIRSLEIRYKSWSTINEEEQKQCESEWNTLIYNCNLYSLVWGTNSSYYEHLETELEDEMLSLFESLLIKKINQIHIHFLMQIVRITDENSRVYGNNDEEKMKQNGIQQILFSTLGVEL